MNSVDQAIIDWANDQLEARGYPRDATGIQFGSWVECYSSWTCDYGVEATIRRAGGHAEVATPYSFPAVLVALPQYVAAREAMEREHRALHDWDDSSDQTVNFGEGATE